VFEISRTWRRFVLPLLLVIMAIMSPVLARVTPNLIRSLSSDDPGVVIQLPDPTSLDALRQWGQSLSQIVLIAVIVIAASLISGDLASGAGQLALVKPLGRSAYILAKVVVLAGFLAILTIVATAICGLLTVAIFGDVPTRKLIELTLVWLVLALLFIAVMTLFSTMWRSQTAASGAGIALYFLISIAAIWQPAKDYSPVGLTSAYETIVSGRSTPLFVPLLTSAVLIVLLLFAAIKVFQRQSIR
jgi:ABC-2 type transport system permease protein